MYTVLCVESVLYSSASMPLAIYSLYCRYVRVSPCLASQSIAKHQCLVFQAKLDTLGMVIYGTELLLWIGVFTCGGYFNLVPWIRELVKKRKTRDQEVGASVERPSGSQNLSLRSFPSSTSVFRTPSALLTMRASSSTIHLESQ